MHPKKLRFLGQSASVITTVPLNKALNPKFLQAYCPCNKLMAPFHNEIPRYMQNSLQLPFNPDSVQIKKVSTFQCKQHC